MATPASRPRRERGFVVAAALLALAGITTLASTGSRPTPTSAASAGDAAAAHAAAGVVTGPEVQAGFERRVEELESRVGAAPQDRALVLELARLLHDGHRTREAIAHYRRAVELDPDEPTAQYDLAAALGEVGDWAQAREVLARRVASAPGDAVALYDLGVVEANLDDASEAVRWWERARAAAGSDAELLARIDDALSRIAVPPPPRPPR